MPPNTHALILHLSDLHFGWDGDDFLKIAQRTVALREMLRVISALEDSWRPNVLCITGDIGWRGKQEDYALAKTWINELLATLRFGSEALFLCPGNHDSDRNFALSNVRPADRTDAERVLKSPLAEQYTRPFASFATFCREIGVPAYRVGELDSYLVGSRLFSGLNFVCLNSAWFSQGDDDKGRLWLGLPQIQVMEARGQLPPSDVLNMERPTVALFHHPKEWFHDDEISASSTLGRPNTFDYLSKRVHLILTGHTHGEVRAADQYAETAWHLTGGAAYAGASHFNTFRLIKLEGRRLIYRSFEFDPRSADQPWKSSGEAHALPLGPVNISRDFAAQRATADAKLQPYRVATREHAKRYILEKARALTPQGTLPELLLLPVVIRGQGIAQKFDPSGRLVRSETAETTLPLFQAARASRRTLLLGDMGTGKSTLAGTLTSEFLNEREGLLALLVQAKAIEFEKGLTISKLLDLISKYANEQIYPALEPLSVHELLKSNVEITLVVDGLDEMPSDKPNDLLRRLYDLPDHWSNVQVVATGRPVELAGVSYENWQVIHPAELTDDNRRALFKYELLAQGKGEQEASQTAETLLRRLRDMPVVYATASTPLAVRLLFPRLQKAKPGELVTIGQLLYDLAKERAGGWGAKDHKTAIAPEFEKHFPDPISRVDLIGCLAVQMVPRDVLSQEEARRILAEELRSQGARRELELTDQALRFYSRSGLLLVEKSVAFPSQSLLEIFQGIGIANAWHRGVPTPMWINERWRVASFATAVLRSRGLIEAHRTRVIELIKGLLKTSQGVLPAAYIVVEARDSECANAYVEGLKKLPPRPLIVDWKAAAPSAQAIALALKESSEGFEWFYEQYLNPKLPYLHRGSAIVDRVFREWAALSLNHLTERQRSQLGALVRPHIAAGTHPVLDIIPVISLLVPEAYSDDERLWFSTTLLDREPFSEIATNMLVERFQRDSIKVNLLLAHLAGGGNISHAKLWKRLNPGLSPPSPVLRTLLSIYARLPEGREDAVCDEGAQIIGSLGRSQSLSFARWCLFDSNAITAAGAAIYLNSSGEDRYALLGRPLLHALHDGGYSRTAEVTLARLVNGKDDAPLYALAEEIARASSDMHGAHSAWWRLFLGRLKVKGKEGAILLGRALGGVGCFLLARHPEVRQSFRDLLLDGHQPEFHEAVHECLYDLDPSIRHGAAMILVVVNPQTEAVALETVVRSRSRQSHGSWHEWEAFLLSLSFGPSTLEHLRTHLARLDSHGRVLALAILARNGMQLDRAEKHDLLRGLLDWRNSHLDRDIHFASAGAFEMLADLLEGSNIDLAKTASRELLRSHKSRLSLSQQAKIALLNEDSFFLQLEEEEKWFERINADSEFVHAVREQANKLQKSGMREPLLSLVASTRNDISKWDDVVWRLMCEPNVFDDSHKEIGGYWLLEQAKKSEHTRVAIGTAAKKFIIDPRVVASRWTDAKQWLAVVADECVGLTQEELEKALRQFPEPIYYAAGAALIARLGAVPKDFKTKQRVGAMPDFGVDGSKSPKGNEMELREFVRSSDTLHPTLCSSIEGATFNVPLSEDQLDSLAAEGPIGSLVAVALAFAYDIAPKLEWIIRYVRYSEKWNSDMQQDRCLYRLTQCWRSALGEANRQNEFRMRLIESLDQALAESDVNFFSVASGIFRLRNGFTFDELKRVLAYYADHPAYYDYGLALPMSSWIIKQSLPEERLSILAEVDRTVTYLDGWSWVPEGSKRTCYPLLLFPSVQWILSDANSPSEVSTRVFLRGLRHLFTVPTDRNTHARPSEVEEAISITSDITEIVQEVPARCLKQVVAAAAMSDDVIVRTVSRFFNFK